MTEITEITWRSGGTEANGEERRATAGRRSRPGAAAQKRRKRKRPGRRCLCFRRSCAAAARYAGLSHWVDRRVEPPISGRRALFSARLCYFVPPVNTVSSVPYRSLDERQRVRDYPRRRPAARPQFADAGVAVRLTELLVGRLHDQRMVQE